MLKRFLFYFYSEQKSQEWSRKCGPKKRKNQKRFIGSGRALHKTRMAYIPNCNKVIEYTQTCTHDLTAKKRKDDLKKIGCHFGGIPLRSENGWVIPTRWQSEITEDMMDDFNKALEPFDLSAEKLRELWDEEAKATIGKIATTAPVTSGSLRKNQIAELIIS